MGTISPLTFAHGVSEPDDNEGVGSEADDAAAIANALGGRFDESMFIESTREDDTMSQSMYNECLNTRTRYVFLSTSSSSYSMKNKSITRAPKKMNKLRYP